MGQRTFYLPDGSTEVRQFDATGRDIHIDAPLSQLVVTHRPEGFIADQLAPIITVTKRSDLYYKFDQADILRIPDTTRAPGTAPKRVGFNVSSETYYAQNYALAYVTAIEDAVNADDVLRWRTRGARFLTDLLMLDYENRVAAKVMSASNVGTATTPGSLWSDDTNSDPVANIDDAIEVVRLRTGRRPNSIAFGPLAWRRFRRHTKVSGKIFPAPARDGFLRLTDYDAVRRLFDVERVLVGGTMKNTAAQNISQSLADIWGPHVLVYYAPTGNDQAQDEPSLMYSFRWQAPGLPAAMAVETLPYDPKVKADELHVSLYQDEKITGTGYGYIVQSVTAS